MNPLSPPLWLRSLLYVVQCLPSRVVASLPACAAFNPSARFRCRAMFRYDFRVLKFIHVVGPRVAEFVAFTLRRSKHTAAVQRRAPTTTNQPANGSLIEGSFAVILEGSDAIVISNITLIRGLSEGFQAAGQCGAADVHHHHHDPNL